MSDTWRPGRSWDFKTKNVECENSFCFMLYIIAWFLLVSVYSWKDVYSRCVVVYLSTQHKRRTEFFYCFIFISNVNDKISYLYKLTKHDGYCDEAIKFAHETVLKRVTHVFGLPFSCCWCFHLPGFYRDFISSLPVFFLRLYIHFLCIYSDITLVGSEWFPETAMLTCCSSSC